ncbi:mitochondrial GTPase 1 [Ischnura elegans]|uniref:mitochondrial GTPase 1 n=1 Tax=Ischnura elegans TaxID=197161 RepID=UPI001ED87482|nr:mitochondrial GTPase 1 [Ischnura elegans]XP_046402864.1 mitochondrial GTPase 1 [Ischnura elegans]
MASPAANITQKFRQSFKIVNKDVLRWFPGHMGKGMRKMQQLLKTVDCVIEVHDARVPITGRNPDFQHKICGVRPHILVLNKKDLIERKDQGTIREKLKKLGISSVFFSNCKDQQCPELKKVIPEATDLISSSNRYNRSEEREYNVLVIGVPNVGKSSLINWLRNRHLKKASAARVGGVAGVTRSVQNRIKVSEEPKVYLLDTPGVLQPTIKNVEAGLKLALCACLQDHLVGEEVIADYLLYTLNNQQNFRYVDLMGLDGPCDDISMVLVKGAIKMNKFQTVKQFDGSLVKKPNVTSAAVFLIREFREGRLGKIILDPIHSDAVEL